MDEPKRRARRAKPEQPEMQTADAQDMRENAPRRRRRAQQNEAQTVKNEADHKPQKKKRSDGWRVLAQGLTSVAALLVMAAAAVCSAAKRIKQEHLRFAAMTLCACVALVSAWQVGSIVLRSVRTNRLNESLAQQRAAIIAAQEAVSAPTAEPELTAEPQPTAEPAPEKPQEAKTALAAAVATAAPDVVKATKYHQVGGDALPEMAQMHQQNRDLVAWIQIPDVLDLPVVYRDNEYYLTRDFSRQKNASGTIFLDENHPFKEKTQNLLLHGHNMKDGTMFGRLAQYLYDDTYLRNHPFISFDTLWHKEQYVIFAVLDVSLDPADPRFFNYFTHDAFLSDAEFSMYIRQLQLRSEFAIPIDVEPADALLTLSTCLDEDRLVIVARRLREGETRSELRTLIRMAARQ